MTKTALYHPENDEFLGYVVRDVAGWQAQTMFGHTIARTTTKKDAEATIRSEGLTFVKGVWQYFDKDDSAWYPCVLKDINEHQVTVQRTNAMGYLDPDDFKIVVLKDPTEQVLIKAT